uniref:Uncharacterized protein n=1 Tax=Arundo donax TaxID=35708 RepID=A0A0A9EUY1_ARUDO
MHHCCGPIIATAYAGRDPLGPSCKHYLPPRARGPRSWLLGSSAPPRSLTHAFSRSPLLHGALPLPPALVPFLPKSPSSPSLGLRLLLLRSVAACCVLLCCHGVGWGDLIDASEGE